MSILNDEKLELIRTTVAETVDILVSDPDFGLVLKPSFKKEVAKRLKSYGRSKSTSFAKIKERYTNV